MLIRSDLFFALGQFSTEIVSHGEDLDICWRAHLAQAQVAVAVQAVAKILPQPASAAEDRMRMRHQIFSLLTCTGAVASLIVVPVAMAVHLVESLVAVIFGRSRLMFNIVGAWTWSLARPWKIWKRRKEIATYRMVSDEKIRKLQDGSFAGLKQFMRAHQCK